ncbi:MAG: RIP metalloprotease RseP [Candidatus Sumerlaeia bacterium]
MGLESKILGLLGVIFTFGLVILVHEFGHFIVAKISGVKVETFSLGFGKKLWKRRWGDTEYCLSAIPFGGYVQLKGTISEEMEQFIASSKDHERDPDPAPDGREHSAGEASLEFPGRTAAPHPSHRHMHDSVMEDVQALRSKPYPIKVAVFAAGVTLNLTMAIATFTFIFWYGLPTVKPLEPVVGWVQPGSAADRAGLEVGDRIVAVGDKPVSNSEEIYEALARYIAPDAGPELTMTIERNGQKSLKTIALPVAEATQQEGAADMDALKEQRAAILDDLFNPPLPAVIGEVTPTGPADKAGLKAGDRIVAIDDRPISNWYELREIVSRNPGMPLRLTIQRDGSTMTREVTVGRDVRDTSKGVIGIVQGTPAESVERERYPLGEAFKRSIETCWHITRMNFAIVWRLISRGELQVLQENVGGPVAIGVMAYKYAQRGLLDFLQFFAAINVIIAAMNLIPFPIFDGGHIALATIESATRRPVPPRVLLTVYQVSLFIIILVAILVTLNDFWQQFLKSLLT